MSACLTCGLPRAEISDYRKRTLPGLCYDLFGCVGRMAIRAAFLGVLNARASIDRRELGLFQAYLKRRAERPDETGVDAYAAIYGEVIFSLPSPHE